MKERIIHSATILLQTFHGPPHLAIQLLHHGASLCYTAPHAYFARRFVPLYQKQNLLKL